jgi:hypothetical protein
MKRLTQQASSTDQANAINNLRDKTQGLSYENNIVGLTGSSGGFLSGTKRAMTWDAQGNLVIDGKVTFRGADLQTTLDGKQAKGDYVMTPTFNTYKQNTVEVLEKLQPKGDYALRDELAKTSGVLRGEIDKVSNSLIGYQLTDNYNKKTDFVLGGDTNTERGSVGLARALVRDSNSALTINYDNDFKGGVNLNASGGFRVRGNMDVGGGFTVGGKPFPAGPAGPAGPIGTMGSIGFTGQPGPAGSIGPQGPIGTMGSMGPAGSMGPLMDKALYLRASNDSFHGLAYGSAGDGAKWGIDGPVLWGNSNGALAAGGLNGPIALTWDKNKNVNVRGNMDVGGEFTVGGKPFTGGPTGPQGPQGPIGTMGSMGFTGQTGPIGTMGSIGFTGQTGPIGTRGSTGLQGLQGFQGPQGPIGTMGSIGPASVFNNAMNDKELRFRGPDDSNHYIAYKNDIDGVRVQGNKGGQLGSLNKTALNWDADNNVYVNNNVFVNSTSNPIQFSSTWSNFPDKNPKNSEISNDTDTYKKLMIVGNKSAGAERRVGIWDRLDVHGNLGVDGKIDVAGDAKFGKVVLGSTLYVNDKSQFLGDAKFGNVALDGTLYVHNKSQFVGDTNFGGNITVNGKPLTDYNKQVDFVLGGDTGTERGPVGSARALVRDNKSGLTINYNNDFTGGVDLNASGGFRVKGDMNVSGRMLSKYTHSPYTDVFGNDIKSINNSNWDNCQIACNSEPACKGFNFENKAWPNLAGTCWLKNNVVNKSNNADWHIFTKNY